jgi:hypothetical protein
MQPPNQNPFNKVASFDGQLHRIKSHTEIQINSTEASRRRLT